MSVRAKLIVIILLISLVPLTVSALTNLSVHQRAYDSKLTELHVKTAEYGASLSNTHIENANTSLSGLVTKSVNWAALSEEERGYALSLVYGQLSDIVVVSLLDELGNGIGSSIYITEAAGDASYKDHPSMSRGALDDFGRSIPFRQASKHGAAIGAPFWTAENVFPIVPLAFAVPAPRDGDAWVVAVGLSMRGACMQLSKSKPPKTSVYLADGEGRVLCGSAGDTTQVLDKALLAHGSDNAAVRYRDSNGTDVVAGIAHLRDGWSVVVEQSVASAFATSRQLRLRVIFWIALGVIAALAAGFFLAQGISRPLRALSDGAGEIQRGNFDYELPVRGGDEFAQLARAFNSMGAEIRVWNAQLHQRVDERTRELKEAQEQLLESRKMAAVASLGAGVAHEINNPLTAVLSLTQILRARAVKDGSSEKQVKILTSIEEGAVRIHDIVKKMHGLSQTYGEGFMNHRPDHVVDAALHAAQAQLDAAGVEVVREYEADLPAVFGNGAQLEEALTQLIDNSIKAMHGERRILCVDVTTVEGELVKIRVVDTGKGIAPENVGKVFEPFYTTKDDWRSRGLGLSVAHRIITAHHGTIRVAKDVEVGATLVITLPIARERSHLV